MLHDSFDKPGTMPRSGNSGHLPSMLHSSIDDNVKSMDLPSDT